MYKKLLFRLVLLSVFVLAIYYLYPDKKLPSSSKIDKLVVYKSERKMIAYQNGQPLKTYRISLGDAPIGHKAFEGDEKTPEGIYSINDRNPNSGWHKNLGISYPNKTDKKHAKTLGKPAGGNVKIHSLKNGWGFIGKFQRWMDWTNGCIAVTDEEMDELYASVQANAIIEIKK